MKPVRLIVLLGLVAVVPTASLADDGRPTNTIPATAIAGPFLLVSLPSLGRVSWRCSGPDDRYSLAFRVGRGEATTTVALVLHGRRVAARTLHPGQAHRFRDAGRLQRLVLVQRTGAGTIRATLDARFLPISQRVASHCWPYAPPELNVTVSARR